MKIQFISPESTYREVQELRAHTDCILIDQKKLNQKDQTDSFQVDDENFDIKKQPLRLIAISLHDLKPHWSVFNDRFKRNTMVISFDDEIQDNPRIVRFLEERGVALLMCKRNKKGLLDYEGLLKSLTSLKFTSILVEDNIDLIEEVTPWA